MIWCLRAPVVPRSVIPPLGSHGFQPHALPTCRSLTHTRPDRVASSLDKYVRPTSACFCYGLYNPICLPLYSIYLLVRIRLRLLLLVMILSRCFVREVKFYLLGRRQAGQRWVDHFTSASVDEQGFTRCVSAPQFFWNPHRQVEMEVHMDDVHGFGPDPQVEMFKGDLATHIWFRDGGVHHEGAEYDHLKIFPQETQMER